MRRKEREITDQDRIRAFVETEQIIRIAFYDDGDIYIVPVNYGFLYDGSYTFYFHGAKSGRKYELAQKEPKVGFEIDGNYLLLEGENACDYSAAFQSIIGIGRLSTVEDTEEKVKGLHAIMRQVTAQKEWEYEPKMLEAVAVFRLQAEHLSCKANL